MIHEKLEQAVFKIFRMTHESNLVWQRKLPPGVLEKATQSTFPAYFETQYQGPRLALFQRHAVACKQLSNLASSPQGRLAPASTARLV